MSLNKLLTKCISYAFYICKIQPSTRSLRERAVNMQVTVFTLARLKIVPTIKNLYPIQCQKHVDELSVDELVVWPEKTLAIFPSY